MYIFFAYVTVSDLPARGQPHSVFGVGACLARVCLLPALANSLPQRESGSLESMFDDARATQTRPRFNVPSERRGATLMSNTQDPHPHWPGIEPGPLAWEADVLTTPKGSRLEFPVSLAYLSNKSMCLASQ